MLHRDIVTSLSSSACRKDARLPDVLRSIHYRHGEKLRVGGTSFNELMTSILWSFMQAICDDLLQSLKISEPRPLDPYDDASSRCGSGIMTSQLPCHTSRLHTSLLFRMQSVKPRG